jgi:hypothetical protein
MRRLNVSVDVMASYLKTSMRNYGLAAANVDITQRPHESIVMGLLDMGIECSIHPTKKESKMMKSLSTQESIVDGLDGRFVFEEGDEGTTAIHPRCKHTAVGFCSLLEVVFYLAALSDKASPMAKLLQKIKAERDAEKNILDKEHMQRYTLKCVCGMPLNDWKPVGLFDAAQDHRSNMGHFLCELCFRQCVSPVSQMGNVINGGVGKCSVPNTKADRAQSFLCLFYGNQAARSGFQKTSGQAVRLHALGSFSTVNVKFKKRGKVKKVRYSFVFLFVLPLFEWDRTFF